MIKPLVSIFVIAFIAVFIIVAVTLGCTYSVYNTDTHHWGFILGTALDFIAGKNLFSEIYIQYGAGQALLFKLLNSVVPITFTSIGVITSILYAGTLLLIFFGMRKLSNTFVAMLITTFMVLLHPHAIYPWPDYYAGFATLLGCFLLLDFKNHKKNTFALLAGVCFFAAILFRNTYLLSFLAAGIVYLLLCLYDVRVREKNVGIALGVLALLTSGYFLLLYYQGNLAFWYAQTIGSGSTQYGITFQTLLNRIKEILFPYRMTTVLITIFYYMGIYVVLSVVFKRKFRNGRLVFFSLLGLAGLSQVLLIFEIFRLQNACAPLFLVGAIVISEFFPTPESLFKDKKMAFLCVWFCINLMLEFPRASSYFPILDGRYPYFASEIPVFKYHRFKSDVGAYYNGLYSMICDGKSVIMNRTRDSIIPYLCTHQPNALSLPFYNKEMIQHTATPEYFPKGLIIVMDEPIDINPEIKLTLLGEVKRPGEVRVIPEAMVRAYRVR